MLQAIWAEVTSDYPHDFCNQLRPPPCQRWQGISVRLLNGPCPYQSPQRLPAEVARVVTCLYDRITPLEHTTFVEHCLRDVGARSLQCKHLSATI